LGRGLLTAQIFGPIVFGPWPFSSPDIGPEVWAIVYTVKFISVDINCNKIITADSKLSEQTVIYPSGSEQRHLTDYNTCTR
jgi:hypothetical protein